MQKASIPCSKAYLVQLLSYPPSIVPLVSYFHIAVIDQFGYYEEPVRTNREVENSRLTGTNWP